MSELKDLTLPSSGEGKKLEELTGESRADEERINELKRFLNDFGPFYQKVLSGEAGTIIDEKRDKFTRGLARLLSYLEYFKNRGQDDIFVKEVEEKMFKLSRKKRDLKMIKSQLERLLDEYMRDISF